MKTDDMKFLAWTFLLFGVFFFSCSKVEPYEDIDAAAMKVTNSMEKHPNVMLSPMETLGKNIFFDKISDPQWVSCATCHGPSYGYSGPIAGININNAGVYRGADPHRFGNRKPPSAAYATFSPIFYFDEEEGLFLGGNFSDGRATGELLGNPAADQALGPFLNFVEQNNKGSIDVLKAIESSKYANLWIEVWGEPIDYSTPEKKMESYGRVGLSIAAFEASPEVNSFSSKYDYYVAGKVELTDEEAWGMQLFNDENKGKCFLCHVSEPGPNGVPALFTDFSYDNIGLPKNPDNPFYNMDDVYFEDGSPINPDGENWIDMGLGGFLANHENPAWSAMASENMGKHKVPTLRNIDKKPGNGDLKAYGHNGYFTSLKAIVHFYNTRDVENWPMPEVAANVNTEELGNLGLTDMEEDAIVAFLRTLSDGYKIK